MKDFPRCRLTFSDLALRLGQGLSFDQETATFVAAAGAAEADDDREALASPWRVG